MRLGDVGGAGRARHFLLEEGEFLREDEGLGEEVEVRHAVPDLHLGDALVHEVLAGEVEGVGEVVDLLVGQQRVVGLHLDDGRRPIERPVLVGVRPLETVLVQHLLYQLHRPVLELVEVTDLVVLGHVAHLRKIVESALLHILVVLLVPLLNALDLLVDQAALLANDNIFARPRLEAQEFNSVARILLEQ